MRRMLFLAAITFMAAISSACIGVITTTVELTASPSLSARTVAETPTQNSRPADSAPTTAVPTTEPTVIPTATPISGPTAVPPVASFSIDVASGSAPLMVEFRNTSQGQTTSYDWDFGDGSHSPNHDSNHLYTMAGTYDVRLKVSGPGGEDTTVSYAAVSVEPGPVARVSLLPTEITLDIGETRRLSFTAFDEYGNETTEFITQ